MLLAGMEDGEDINDVRSDAIDQDVVGMDDRSARASDADGAVDVGVIGQTVGGVLERLTDPGRGGGVAVDDLMREFERVGACIRVPDDGEGHFALARSMIPHILALI